LPHDLTERTSYVIHIWECQMLRVLRISMINARAIEINRVLLVSCVVCDVTESEKRRKPREPWGYDGAIMG